MELRGRRMSLTVNNSLFVYSPISGSAPFQSAGAASLVPQAPKSGNADTSQNNQNNSAKGYKNEPNVNVTGEKILSSMPDKKKNEKSVNNLTEGEQAQVDKLKKRDAEVKTHEQAHLAAGGAYAKGGASYSYQTGPDGRQYAVGGEVQIDTSPIKNDPQATIMKAQVIKAAALAPSQPSGQDKAVAAKAQQMIAKAQNELIQKNPENNDDKIEKTDKKSENKNDKTEQTDKNSENNGSNEIQNIITNLVDITA